MRRERGHGNETIVRDSGKRMKTLQRHSCAFKATCAMMHELSHICTHKDTSGKYSISNHI